MAIFYTDSASFEILTVTNLTAQTSSISYLTQSQLNVENNLITVNTNTPQVRFGGFAVIDSGSSNLSGSLLFDSQNNQWIYVHQSAPGAAITSSVLIMGPQTFDNIGGETTITTNRLTKGSGGDLGEHITSSNVTDTGTLVSINSNTEVTGSFDVTLGSTSELRVRSTGIQLGSVVTDLHQITGSLIVTNSITGSSFTGSFVGNGAGLTGISATSAPAGPASSVQFNDAGSASGSANFTFNKTTNTVFVTGSVAVSGSVLADNTEQFVRITSNFVINAGAANALQNVTGLTFDYLNGEEYYFLFYGLFTTNASTVGTRWTVNGTNFAQLAYTSEYTLTATTTTRNAMLSAVQLPAATNLTSNASNGGGNFARIEGMFLANGNGTFQIQGAREATTDTVTLLAGSYLKYKKV